MAAPRRWDIFCRVVDNYGDIGVSWRLARQLAGEFGLAPRLWVDDLASFARLWPALDAQCAVQRIDGVEVCRWDAAADAATPSAVVIETFGCGLPDGYLAAMAQVRPPPVWVNVEHLTAEDFAAAHHGLPSPHPRLPLTCWFYYPGFEPACGGLLREADLTVRRALGAADASARARMRAQLDLPPPPTEALWVSLFCYPDVALPGLLQAWAEGERPLVCFAPDTPALRSAARRVGAPLAPGARLERGALTLAVLPFLAQPDYDRLLWVCDANFVRGEDSFLRAQWAARPFVWHIYPQHDGAHWAKLEAFLARHAAGLPEDAAGALRALTWAWNRAAPVGAEWARYAASLPVLGSHAVRWAQQLEGCGSLAARLVEFCAAKVQ